MCIIIHLYCKFCKCLNPVVFDIEEVCFDVDPTIYDCTSCPDVVIKVKKSNCGFCAENFFNDAT